MYYGGRSSMERHSKIGKTCVYWRTKTCFKGDGMCQYVHGFICRDDGICSNQSCTEYHLKQRDPPGCARRSHVPPPRVRSFSRSPRYKSPKRDKSPFDSPRRRLKRSQSPSPFGSGRKNSFGSPKRSNYSPKRRSGYSPSRSPYGSPRRMSPYRSRKSISPYVRRSYRSPSPMRRRKVKSPFSSPKTKKRRNSSSRDRRSSRSSSSSSSSTDSDDHRRKSAAIKKNRETIVIPKETGKKDRDVTNGKLSSTKEKESNNSILDKAGTGKNGKLESKKSESSNEQSKLSPSAQAMKILDSLPLDFFNNNSDKKKEKSPLSLSKLKSSGSKSENPGGLSEESFKEAFLKALSKSNYDDTEKHSQNDGSNALTSMMKHPMNPESLAKPFQEKLFSYKSEESKDPIWPLSQDKDKKLHQNDLENMTRPSDWEMDANYLPRNSRESTATSRKGGSPIPTTSNKSKYSESKKKRKKRRISLSSSSSSDEDKTPTKKSDSTDEDEEEENSLLEKKKSILVRVWTLMNQKKKLDEQRNDIVCNHKGDGKSLSVILQENNSLSAEIDRQIFIMNQMVQVINDRLGISQVEQQSQEFFLQPSMYNKDSPAMPIVPKVSGKPVIDKNFLSKVNKFLKNENDKPTKSKAPSKKKKELKSHSPLPRSRSRSYSPLPISRSPSSIPKSRYKSRSPQEKEILKRYKSKSRSPHRSLGSRDRKRSHSHEKRFKSQPQIRTPSPKEAPKSKKDKKKDKLKTAKGSVKIPEASIEYAPSPALKPHIKYVDQGMHWCQVCNDFLDTVSEYIDHLDTPAHIHRLKSDQKTWLPKYIPPKKEQIVKGAPLITIPIQGMEYLHSMTAFYCSLCDEFIKTRGESCVHCETKMHVSKYKDHLAKNSMYETTYVKNKMAAYAKYTIDKEKNKERNIKNEENTEDFFHRGLIKCDDDIGLYDDLEKDDDNSDQRENFSPHDKAEGASIRVALRSSLSIESREVEMEPIKPIEKEESFPKDEEQVTDTKSFLSLEEDKFQQLRRKIANMNRQDSPCNMIREEMEEKEFVEKETIEKEPVKLMNNKPSSKVMIGKMPFLKRGAKPKIGGLHIKLPSKSQLNPGGVILPPQDLLGDEVKNFNEEDGESSEVLPEVVPKNVEFITEIRSSGESIKFKKMIGPIFNSIKDASDSNSTNSFDTDGCNTNLENIVFPEKPSTNLFSNFGEISLPDSKPNKWSAIPREDPSTSSPSSRSKQSCFSVISNIRQSTEVFPPLPQSDMGVFTAATQMEPQSISTVDDRLKANLMSSSLKRISNAAKVSRNRNSVNESLVPKQSEILPLGVQNETSNQNSSSSFEQSSYQTPNSRSLFPINTDSFVSSMPSTISHVSYNLIPQSTSSSRILSDVSVSSPYSPQFDPNSDRVNNRSNSVRRSTPSPRSSSESNDSDDRTATPPPPGTENVYLQRLDEIKKILKKKSIDLPSAKKDVKKASYADSQKSGNEMMAISIKKETVNDKKKDFKQIDDSDLLVQEGLDLLEGADEESPEEEREKSFERESSQKKSQTYEDILKNLEGQLESGKRNTYKTDYSMSDEGMDDDEIDSLLEASSRVARKKKRKDKWESDEEGSDD